MIGWKCLVIYYPNLRLDQEVDALWKWPENTAKAEEMALIAVGHAPGL